MTMHSEERLKGVEWMHGQEPKYIVTHNPYQIKLLKLRINLTKHHGSHGKENKIWVV